MLYTKKKKKKKKKKSNLRNSINLKIVNNEKKLLKLTSKPSYMSYEIFSNNRNTYISIQNRISTYIYTLE